ncbi:hypothetical protein [Streptomyces sp. NPDC058157]|uniref:SCO2583/SCO2584 N-terminal domain-containing protein n=1 Tax=Streptomyces sp. NPDC058157 TaxID=3346360 RepID=UPI0036EE3B28
MAKNDAMPPAPGGPGPDGPDGPDEDEWNVVLDEDFVRGASIHESAATGRSRTWPLVLGLFLLMGLLALVTLEMSDPADEERVTARPRRTPAATATPAPAAPAAPAAGRPMVPLAEVFPAEVADGSGSAFTRVDAKVLGSCTEPDSVGPRLAAMITEGKGCVGEQVALYQDAEDNRFGLAVFTLADPQDTLRVVTGLTTAYEDHQVGVPVPSAASGLPLPGPGTGRVQSFTGAGRVAVVGLGQWSDGRDADLRRLADRLGPLQEAVGRNVDRYEAATAP